MTVQSRHLLGWCAVVLSTMAACFWAFWGIIENFHEGWYHPSLALNLALMAAQYLLPMILFVSAALVAIRWPHLGGGLHFAAAVLAAWFFRAASPVLLSAFIVGPLVALALFYWVGRPEPRRLAIAVAVGLPLLTLIVFGAEPAWRVAHRLNDGNQAAVRVSAGSVDLIWAPSGPGWPLDGVTWDEALRRCQYLTADGTSFTDEPQNIWRLPTVEEAVRSMQRHGQNCGGTWDVALRQAVYSETPDKESPLWNVYSPVIYWWTATEVDDRSAYMIVFDGKVWPRPKRAH